MNWATLNKHRVSPSTDPHFGSTAEDGFNGFFCFVINGLPVKCIASDGEGWRHVSVSIEGAKATPSWSTMAKVKDLFWDEEATVMQLHPPKSEYVNEHPYVLHLWEPLNASIPLPPRLMVGCRDDEDRRKVNQSRVAPFVYIGKDGKTL